MWISWWIPSREKATLCNFQRVPKWALSFFSYWVQNSPVFSSDLPEGSSNSRRSTRRLPRPDGLAMTFLSADGTQNQPCMSARGAGVWNLRFLIILKSILFYFYPRYCARKFWFPGLFYRMPEKAPVNVSNFQNPQIDCIVRFCYSIGTVQPQKEVSQ